MRKLTKKETSARLVIYDNISDYLLTTGSGEEETKQAVIVRKQIDKIANNFYKKYAE